MAPTTLRNPEDTLTGESSFDVLPPLTAFHPPFNAKLRLPRSNSRRPATSVNPDTAAWFASLPSAIRRKHFSKEEQVLLANERQTVILDAADELLQRQVAPLDSASLTLRPHTSYSDACSERYFSFDDFDSERDPANDWSPQESDVEEMEPKQLVDSLSWLDEGDELDLRLDDYHTAIAETNQRQAAAPHRQSYRRTLSLSNMSLRRSSISSPTKSVTRGSTPPVPPKPAQAPATPNRQSMQHGTKSSVSSIDPRATHYQDPAARMKLRVYLASPSKFDEAVEFGFPSMQDKLSKASERPKTSPRTTNDSGRSFSPDDTPSLAGDDGSSQGDAFPDPRTPDDSEFREIRRSQKSSVDRTSVKPQVVRHEPYAHSTTFDREMTIHMTLTRPDLRSPSDYRPSSRHINAQPLEQPPLPPLDNPAAVWNELPAPRPSRVKNLWRRLKMA
ncbi:uncharacterized protein HMPREF1541_10567 [Cyphellophora europaea CBS 101466]|uniref:Uncharacterized protein n=1 Tax=Cyphellophora europaea (strain CBS 101466) TaxID=1220924 RepID=W2S6V1_CYPE1|nr:uncharacterized protein HMPREF1541_10567 [Cyphellophora europaea CBS 101466]ETN44387.1 hypothetical protein HMPREF1541_10567 [Cyphellophora europaea CBS 101466]